MRAGPAGGRGGSQPVTTKDVLASLKRWAVRDSVGQILWSKLAEARSKLQQAINQLKGKPVMVSKTQVERKEEAKDN